MFTGLEEVMNYPRNHFKINHVHNQLLKDMKKYTFHKDQYQYYITGLYDYIKQNIIQTNEKTLESIAYHYFQKEGKLVRPLIAFLLSELLFNINNKSKSFQSSVEIYESQKNWGAICEILHISSLIHDDIIDNALTRRGIKATHTVFGKRSACFGANFILGRGVQKIAFMSHPQLFQIYSLIMDNLTSGEYIQAKKNKNYNDMDQLLRDYTVKSYYKTGSLISNTCRGSILISDENLEIQTLGFKFGQHLGIAFQLIDDILDYTESSEQLGKPALSDLREGVVTGPLLFALYEMQNDSSMQKEYQTLMNICLKQEKSNDDITNALAAKILKMTRGLDFTNYLAFLNVQKSIECIEQIIKQKNKTIDDPAILESYNKLVGLALQVLRRKN